MLIQEIIDEKSRIIELKKKERPAESLEVAGNTGLRSLSHKVKTSTFSIIPEIKRASPSAGRIDMEIDIAETAVGYQEGGAAGISVLTCEPFFHGSIEDLQVVSKKVRIPVLLKDFVIDSYQLTEARAFGADAVLLIVRILSEKKLDEMIDLSDKLGLETLIEVHNREEVETALSVVKDWENRILGINNRNLDTLEIDIETTFDLIKSLNRYKISVISESGIRSYREIERLKKAGIKGALVGESILKSPDIRAKLAEMTGNKSCYPGL